jgi:hypothetical protein
MARRPLGEAGPSKLARRAEEGDDTPLAPKLTAPRAPVRQPTSFRLDGIDIDRLQRLTSKVSQEAGRPISRGDLLKGLLLMGDKSDAKRLLSAIKDAAFEG